MRKRRPGAKGDKRSTSRSLDSDFAAANAKFDRLLEAMAKTPALPKRKRRVVVRQVPDEKFDD